MAPTGSDVVALAQQQISNGATYSWGAETPPLFDCSGLVYYIAQQLGLGPVPRVTFDQYRDLTQVARDKLQVGDLIYSHWSNPTTASHVGIYGGKNQQGQDVILEAGGPEGARLTATPMGQSYWSHVDGIRRLPGLGKPTGSIDPDLGDVANAGGLVLGDTLTSAVNSVATQVHTATQGLTKMGDLAGLVVNMFAPNNILRGWFGAMGVIFLLIGIWFLAREIKQS